MRKTGGVSIAGSFFKKRKEKRKKKKEKKETSMEDNKYAVDEWCVGRGGGIRRGKRVIV